MFLQKLGGRKFLLALFCIVVGSVIDFYTERGLSPALAGLMGSIVAAFSMANYAVSKAHFQSKAEPSQSVDGGPDLSGIDELKLMTTQLADGVITTKASVDAIKSILISAIKSGERS